MIKLKHGTTLKGRTEVTKLTPELTGVTRVVDGFLFHLVAVVPPQGVGEYQPNYVPNDEIDETSIGYLRDDLWQAKINGKDYRMMATKATSGNLDPNTNNLSGYIYTSPRSQWTHILHVPDLSLSPGPHKNQGIIHLEVQGVDLIGTDYSFFGARSSYVRGNSQPAFYGGHGGDADTPAPSYPTLHGYLQTGHGIAHWVSV